MMDAMIGKFPAQLKEALEIGKAANIRMHDGPIHKAYVAGLGGSGIGANFVAEYIRQESPIPYSIGKGYTIPSFIDKNTLAIVSSYSGNTEETLHSFNKILERGAKVVVISSGGKLIEKAIEYDLDYIKLPDNWASPRACLGYSLVQQIAILTKLEIISDTCMDQIAAASNLINYDQDDIKEQAQKIAKFLFDKIPVLYSVDKMESAVIRFRQQINENAKMLCWHHVVPEMNHNELVGWRQKNEQLAVLFFRNETDLERNKLRIDINKEIISKCTPNIMELHSKGNSHIENSLFFVHLGDWVSWYLSKLNNVDAVEIDVIDYLKSNLAKVDS